MVKEKEINIKQSGARNQFRTVRYKQSILNSMVKENDIEQYGTSNQYSTVW